MRPIFWYIALILAATFIGMFFASQHSRQVQIGYELTRLREERSAAIEDARKLDIKIANAATRDALVETARKLGLVLKPPVQRDQ